MINLLIRFTLLLSCFMLISNLVLAQIGNGGWLNITHTQKLSSKFDMLADFQFRSSNDYDYLSTLLLRGALSYNFNKQHSMALGYGNITDWEMINEEKVSTNEHRIFEQYLYKKQVENLRLNFRGRLEQRFRGADAVFSQRLRLQIGALIPLIANKDFTKGMYSVLNSEIMFNVQNKDKVNNSFFDQHRPYIAFGYRFNKKIDTELGYLRWQQRKTSGDQERDIIQFKILSNF